MNPPNIVLIIADHHRGDYLGCLGGSLLTPNLDSMARGGAILRRMYCVAPACVPSRIALSTGRYPMNTGRYTNHHPVDPHAATWYQSLRSAGLYTALIGKFHHHVHVPGTDFRAHEEDLNRLGFDHIEEVAGKACVKTSGIECRYTDYLRESGMLQTYREWKSDRDEPWPWDEETRHDVFIARRACRFLEKVDRSKPFFLQVGFVGPHPPLDAPQRFRDLYRQIDPPEPVGGANRDVAHWKAFAAGVSETDELVGRIRKTIRESGLDGDTVVIYTSDHGEMAGDHGRDGKVYLYEGSVRVPLIATGPGIPAGLATDELAELIDIGSTVCEFAGCVGPPQHQGKSFADLLHGASTHHRTDVYAEMGGDKMLFDGRYKLMYGDYLSADHAEPGATQRERHLVSSMNSRPVTVRSPRVSLYDLATDPIEEQNLADDPDFAGVRAAMVEKLLDRMVSNAQSEPDRYYEVED